MSTNVTLDENYLGTGGPEAISKVGEGELLEARRRRLFRQRAVAGVALLVGGVVAGLQGRGLFTPSGESLAGAGSGSGDYLVSAELRVEGDVPFSARLEGLPLSMDEGERGWHHVVLESDLGIIFQDARWISTADLDGSSFATTGSGCAIQPIEEMMKRTPPDDRVVSVCTMNARSWRTGPGASHKEIVYVYAGLDQRSVALGTFELRQLISWKSATTPDGTSPEDGKATVIITYTVSSNS